MQLKILEVNKKSGYFEVNFEMTLDYTQAQQTALGQTTKVTGGVASYPNGTTINSIKADLQARLQKAQDDLSSDTTYAYYGVTFDGNQWNI